MTLKQSTYQIIHQLADSRNLGRQFLIFRRRRSPIIAIQDLYQYMTMRAPMTLTYRHIDHSGALEDRARILGARLERLGERITQCHMTLEGPGNGGNAGAPYLVKIELNLPSARIHADSLHIDGAGHQDIYLALRDAFNNARRQLQDLHRYRTKSAQ